MLADRPRKELNDERSLPSLNDDDCPLIADVGELNGGLGVGGGDRVE